MGKAPTLKHIDFERGWFDANGSRYYVQNSLSFNRYKEYMKMQHELAYGVAPEDIKKYLEWQMAQFVKPESMTTKHAIVERNKNLIEAYSDAKIGEDKRLVFCTLFVNREDEDITVWDEKLAKSKINDWSEEGYDVGDFFLLSAKLSPSSRAKYMQLHGLSEKDVQGAADEIKSNERGGTG